MTIYSGTIKLRRGAKATWESENPALKYGEVAIVWDGTTPKLKVGNAAEDLFNDLPYVTSGAGMGADGLSAYEVAVANGFIGSEAAWLLSLVGADGADGGEGLSAYEVAVANGFVGNEAAWLLSLVGADGADGSDGAPGADGSNGSNGADGADGLSAYEVAVANGFIGNQAAWLLSLVGADGADGSDGAPGADGSNGSNGADGADGLSAYEVAVANGFIGNEAAWLLSLVGADGADGADGAPGADGANGSNGADGLSAYEVAVANGFIGNEAAWLLSLVGADGADGADGAPGADGANGSNGADGSSLLGINTQTGSYTLVLTDKDKLVEMNVGSANNITVPPNSSVAFPNNTQIMLTQYGAGQTTVVAGSGVTIRSDSGKLKIATQYSGATLIKKGTDEWYLFGNLTT